MMAIAVLVHSRLKSTTAVIQPKSRYYKERQVDRKKRKAIRR